MKRKRGVLLIAHGGAGPRRATAAQLQTLSRAIEAGFGLLKKGAPSLDAVEATIRILEDSGRFNAGRGSRLQLDGRRRMDAALMEGQNLRAGAVASIEDIKNPITMARKILQSTPHVLVAGEGAAQLARFFKMEKAKPPTRRAREALRQAFKKGGWAAKLYKSVYGHETVGAVALDRTGHLAAGASTGGIASMFPGRIGDSPLIGCGLYADDNAGAVSMTGWGENIIRAGSAREICCYLESGMTARKATARALKRLLARIPGSEAGAIVLAPRGQFALMHTSAFMCAGYRVERGRAVVAAGFHRVRK